jgi:hypothetical protein
VVIGAGPGVHTTFAPAPENQKSQKDTLLKCEPSGLHCAYTVFDTRETKKTSGHRSGALLICHARQKSSYR